MSASTSVTHGRLKSLRYDVPPESRLASKALQSRMYEAALSRINLRPHTTPGGKSEGHLDDSEPLPRPPPPMPEPHPSESPCSSSSSVPLARFSLLSGKVERIAAQKESRPAPAAATPRPGSPLGASAHNVDCGVSASPGTADESSPHVNREHPAASKGPIASADWLKSFEAAPQHFGAAVVKRIAAAAPQPAGQTSFSSSWTSEQVVRNRQKQQLLELQQRRMEEQKQKSTSVEMPQPTVASFGRGPLTLGLQKKDGAAPPAPSPRVSMMDSPFYQPHLAAKREWREAKEKRRQERHRRRQEAAAAATTAGAPAATPSDTSKGRASDARNGAVTPTSGDAPKALAPTRKSSPPFVPEIAQSKAPSLRNLLNRGAADSGRSTLFSGLIAAGDVRVLQFLLPGALPFAETEALLAAAKTAAPSRTRAAAHSQTFLGNALTRLCVVIAAEEKVHRAELADAEDEARRAARQRFNAALGELMLLSMEEEEEREGRASSNGEPVPTVAEDESNPPDDSVLIGEAGPSHAAGCSPSGGLQAPCRGAQAPCDGGYVSPGRAEREALAVRHALSAELELFAENFPVRQVLASGAREHQLCSQPGSHGVWQPVFVGSLPVGIDNDAGRTANCGRHASVYD